MRTLVVTGANGYVGRHFVATARAAGWRVVAATRRRLQTADDWIAYDFASRPDARAFPQGAPIVHLAAVTSADADARVELEAARALLDVARSQGTFVLFASSQAARADAPSAYGRSKHAIEQDVLRADGIVVRPGLVVGGSPGGLYATLLHVARTAPLWPAVVPAPLVQPVLVDELAQALLRMLDAPGRWRGRVTCIGADEPVSFNEWMRALAASRGRRLRMVPVPAMSVRVGAAVVERCGGASLAARARSLIAIAPMECRGDLAELGLVLAPPLQPLRERANARAIIAEGTALLRYILGEAPALALVRRYVRVIGTLRNERPLPLPAACLRWPALVRVLDQPPVRAAGEEWRWRLHAATTIAEASVQGARRFLPLAGSSSRAGRVAGAGLALALDVVARVASRPFAWTRFRPGRR